MIARLFIAAFLLANSSRSAAFAIPTTSAFRGRWASSSALANSKVRKAPIPCDHSGGSLRSANIISGVTEWDAIPRGGDLGGRLRSAAAGDKSAAASASSSGSGKKGISTKYLAVGATITLVAWKREFLLSAVRSWDLQTFLIAKLDQLDGYGNTGLIAYSLAFAVWEIFVGVTTPVETAAGMAFGVKRGIIASAIGKMGGAFIAFLIGRFLLFDYVSEKLGDNEMMELVKDSIRENPVGVALIWRFSFLPEQIKTFGLSVLPLKIWQFVTALVLHGLPFTVLWTCMGAEAGALARGLVDGPSKLLKILVGWVYIFGFFISPTMVGMWVKSLKDRQKEKRNKA